MSMLERNWDDFTKNRHQFFATFVTSDDIAMLDVKDETCVPLITDNYGDWTDDIAVTLGSDVLRRCIGYPVERVRQRLYKTWLARFAAQEWPDTFDQDLLECVVATPSPSDPTKPLFGDLFRLAAVSPRPERTFLDTSTLSPLFKRPAVLDADFKTAKGLVAYLDGLLYVDDRKALHEAGLIIGFLSLLLSSVTAVSVNRLMGIFRDLEKIGLATVLPTSFSGEFPCPTSANLENLRNSLCLGHPTAMGGDDESGTASYTKVKGGRLFDRAATTLKEVESFLEKLNGKLEALVNNLNHELGTLLVSVEFMNERSTLSESFRDIVSALATKVAAVIMVNDVDIVNTNLMTATRRQIML
ncbi:hypothetical protein V5799_016783 [Amblyomma americanum]|uniref:Uncharacterized protein n=1 Tax=Amblyomma americanum TaxID=6943 RepID=A0AAQ4F5C1_AMBAM